jgi:hypothetical protein
LWFCRLAFKESVISLEEAGSVFAARLQMDQEIVDLPNAFAAAIDTNESPTRAQRYGRRQVETRLPGYIAAGKERSHYHY